MVTLGVLPKSPVAVTEALAVAAELDFVGVDELQPATASAASSGIAISA
jgi:hypothetical protein